MGMDGISGGGAMKAMQALQATQALQGAPDIKKLQEAGSKLDQEAKQLAELIKNAIASGADPQAIKALQAQLAQVQQQAANVQTQAGGVDASGGGGQGGAAALELARKMDDLKKQIESLAQSAAMSNAGGAQNQQQQQQHQQAFGQDQNQVRGRDMMQMY